MPGPHDKQQAMAQWTSVCSEVSARHARLVLKHFLGANQITCKRWRSKLQTTSEVAASLRLEAVVAFPQCALELEAAAN